MTCPLCDDMHFNYVRCAPELKKEIDRCFGKVINEELLNPTGMLKPCYACNRQGVRWVLPKTIAHDKLVLVQLIDFNPASESSMTFERVQPREPRIIVLDVPPGMNMTSDRCELCEGQRWIFIRFSAAAAAEVNEHLAVAVALDDGPGTLGPCPSCNHPDVIYPRPTSLASVPIYLGESVNGHIALRPVDQMQPTGDA